MCLKLKNTRKKKQSVVAEGAYRRRVLRSLPRRLCATQLAGQPAALGLQLPAGLALSPQELAHPPCMLSLYPVHRRADRRRNPAGHLPVDLFRRHSRVGSRRLGLRDSSTASERRSLSSTERQRKHERQ